MSPSGGRGTLTALVLSALLAGLAAGFADSMMPFYSVTFVAGVAVTFYLAITFGPRPALYLGTAVLVTSLLRAAGQGGEELQVAALQAPFLALFFVGFSSLPMAVPTILDQETRELSREVDVISRKVEDLKRTLAEEHKDKVKDKGSEAREEVVRVTSRNTQLTTFLREVLQAASAKEIFNLLFSNTTKAYGNLEVGLILVLEGGAELIVSRAAHPDHEKLENHRFPASSAPLLQSAMGKNVPVLLPERMLLVPEHDFGCKVIVPVQVDGSCEALLTLGKTRGGGEPEGDDAQFLGTFAELASEGVAQMRVVLGA